MLEWTPYPGQDAARLAYRGTVTDDDYAAVLPQIESFVEDRDDVRLLIDLTEFEGIGPKAILDDLGFTAKHLDEFGRVAVVSDVGWHEQAASLSDLFTRAKIRAFAPHERRRAEAWLLPSRGAALRRARG